VRSIGRSAYYSRRRPFREPHATSYDNFWCSSATAGPRATVFGRFSWRSRCLPAPRGGTGRSDPDVRCTVPQVPAGVEILLANCLAHGRRQFVELAANFPAECRYVLEMLGQVYGHDAEARQRGLTPAERLRFHQERTSPVMAELHRWLERQFAEKKKEPNSGLDKAITYLLRHRRPLTTFLREADAPLDNNIVERALKRSALRRKKCTILSHSQRCAGSDLFVSLIHTCQLSGVNSFQYLIELQRHAQQLAANPAQWMPWNYRKALAGVS
jgi:transposase